MSFLLSGFRRKGTRANFKDNKAILPNVQEERTHVEHSTKVEEGKERREVDKEVDKHEDRDEQADDRDKPTSSSKDKGKVKDNVAVGRSGTTNLTSVNEVFAKFWSGSKHYHMKPLTFSSASWFVPNALPLIVLCNIAIPLVARTKWILQEERTFLPYAVATALCYVYYIRILQAKEAAGELTGRESSALTRFRKMVKEEKVIIPGPFVPFFYNIVATQLEDRKYDWVIPHYGDLADFAVADPRNPSYPDSFSDVNYLRPIIPHMLAMLSSFGSYQTTGNGNITTRVDDELIFTPVDIDGTANRTIFGRATDFTTANTMANPNRHFMSCGTTVPFQFWNENYPDALNHLRRSKFFGTRSGANSSTGIDIAVTTGRTLPNNVGAITVKDCHLIDNFLFLEKDKNAAWSSYIFDQLAVFAKHFKGNKNLSELPTTGGMETSIICQLRTPTAHTNGYVYDSNNLGITGGDTQRWYMDRFDNMNGYFRSTRADITREEELQAITFAPNALPPIHNANRSLFRGGDYFDHINGANVATDLLEIGDPSNEVKGYVEMYQGWSSDVVRQLFIAKPE